jgi:MFS family permease
VNVRKWIPLLILATAQFIVVIDTTILNVSIGVLVEEFNTSVTSIQAAIASYALVTATLLLTGGRAAETLKLRRVLAAGLAFYAAGSALAAVSTNISMLYVGWSGLEGIGAAFVLPAVLALTAATYRGRDRRIAFAVIGSTAAAAVAMGPLLGGAAATFLSWRVAFGVETAIAIPLIFSVRLLVSPPRTARKRNFDIAGALLSISALSLIVVAVINGSRWGWLQPRQEVAVGDTAIQLLGLPPTLLFLGAGATLWLVFWWWSNRRVRRGERPLIDPVLFHSKPIMSGAAAQLIVSLILAGVLFTIPLYLAVVLGENPFQIAIALLPLTILVLATAVVSLLIPERFSPKRRVELGMLLMIFGTSLLAWRIDEVLRDGDLAIALALIGMGVGLSVTQLGGMILPAANVRIRGEASALKGTSRYLGSAVGTGILGSILIVGLTASFVDRINDIPAIASDEELVADLERAASTELDFMSNAEMRSRVDGSGLSVALKETLVRVNEQARVDALQAAFVAATAFGVLGLAVSFALPAHRVVDRHGTRPDVLPESW